MLNHLSFHPFLYGLQITFISYQLTDNNVMSDSLPPDDKPHEVSPQLPTGKKGKLGNFKKKADNDQVQNTMTESTKIRRKAQRGQRGQILITSFIAGSKNTNTYETTTSHKAEEYLTSFPPNKFDQLENEIRAKDEMIQFLQAEREKEQMKASRMNIDFKQIVTRNKEVMVNCSRQLAQIRRKQKGVNPKMGYFKDSNCNSFWEGDYLTGLRRELINSETIQQRVLKQMNDIKSPVQKEKHKCRAEFLRQEINDIKAELAMREKQLARYKERLRLFLKEEQCQMAKEGWPLLKNKYLPLQLIGTGGFGEVYKGFDFQRLGDVAIKISLPDSRFSSTALENFLKHLRREVSTHRQLQHPNIVRVLDQIQLNGGRMGLVMQYCSGPELKSYLKKLGCLEEREARHIVQQLVYAVKYLHEQKMRVVHYDLKPANILFHQGIIKVVDFGICKTIEGEDTKIQLTSQGIGTYWYLPPEVFDEVKGQVSSKVDIWSIGVIFFELLYGEKPFGNGCTQGKILREGLILSANKVQFPIQSPKKYKISTEAKDFIRACLKYEVNERLSPIQAFEHSYIKD